MKIKHTEPAAEFYTDERCYITELVNSADIGAYSLAQSRVLSGVTTVLHSLDVDETYYILSGCGRLQLGDEVVGDMRRGDFVHIPAQVQQRITNIGDEDLVFLCICTPRFRVESYLDLEAPDA